LFRPFLITLFSKPLFVFFSSQISTYSLFHVFASSPFLPCLVRAWDPRHPAQPVVQPFNVLFPAPRVNPPPLLRYWRGPRLRTRDFSLFFFFISPCFFCFASLSMLFPPLPLLPYCSSFFFFCPRVIRPWRVPIFTPFSFLVCVFIYLLLSSLASLSPWPLFVGRFPFHRIAFFPSFDVFDVPGFFFSFFAFLPKSDEFFPLIRPLFSSRCGMAHRFPPVDLVVLYLSWCVFLIWPMALPSCLVPFYTP